MNYCPQCKTDYPGNVHLCPTHGIRLQHTAGAPRPSHSPHVLAPTDPRDVDVEEPTQTQWTHGGPAGDEMPTQAIPTINESAPESDEPEEPNLVGSVVAGRYRIQRRLGEGGMGVVYAALDERIEKEIAIKVLRSDYSRRSDVVQRFTQEAKSAARIKHENVLDVTDYGQTDDGGFYIAMELLRGTDLADVLMQHKTLGPARGIEIAVQVCRALAAAHAKGIVHRDLKPENVFLVRTDDDREIVKIVDFGIAQMKDIGGGESNRKLTRTGMIFGTPEYMSPEQAAGRPIDHRVDIYATGVILYEMFAGRVPFVGDSFMGILTQHMFEHPTPISAVNPAGEISPELESVVFKAMAKDPNARYGSMLELAEDLNRVRAGNRPTAPTPDFSENLPKPPGGSRVPASPTASGLYGTASVQTPQITGVSRTIEREIPGPQRKPLWIAAVIFAVLGIGVLAAALGTSKNRTDTTTHATPPVVPPTATPPPETHPTNTPAGSTHPPQVAVPTPATPDAAVAPTETVDSGATAVQEVDAGTQPNAAANGGHRARPRRPTAEPNGHGRPRCGMADPTTGLLIPCFEQTQ